MSLWTFRYAIIDGTDALHRSSTNYVIIYGNLNITFRKMTRHRTKSNSPMPGYKPSFHLSRFTLNSRNHLRIETHHWTSERWCFNDLTFSATVFERILNWSRFYSVFGVVLWARARSNCKWMSRATLNYASNKIISIWWVCHALSVSIKTLHNYHNVMAKFKQRYSFILSLEHRFNSIDNVL